MDSLQAIAPDHLLGKDFRAMVYSSQKILFRFNKTSIDFVAAGYLLAITLALVIVPALAYLGVIPVHTSPLRPKDLREYFVILLLFSFCFVLTPKHIIITVLRRSLKMIAGISLIFSVLLASIGNYISTRYALANHDIAPPIVHVLFSCAIAWLAFGVSILMIPILKIIRSRRFPYSEAIDDLLLCVHLLQQKPNAWSSPAFRHRLLVYVENAARVIHRNIPSRYKCADLTLGSWYSHRCYSAAQCLRGHAYCLLTPREDTRRYLLSRLRHFTISFAMGRWDEFETFNQPAPRPIMNFISHAKRFTTAAIAGLLPLFLYYLLQKSQFALTGNVADWIRGAAAVWAMLSLLAVMDSSYEAKFGVMQRMPDILGIIKGKK